MPPKRTTKTITTTTGVDELDGVNSTVKSIVAAGNWWERFVLFTKKNPISSLFAAMFIIAFSIIMILGYNIVTTGKIPPIISERFTPTPQEKSKEFVKNVEAGKQILDQLQMIQDKYKSDRVAFFKLHDTQKDLQNKHFFFFSLTHEKSSIGTTFTNTSFQNINTNLLNEWNQIFLKNQCVHRNYEDIGSTFNNVAGRTWDSVEFGEKNGVRTLIACPVYDTTHSFFTGFVVLSYTKNCIQSGIDEKFLRETSLIISGIVGAEK